MLGTSGVARHRDAVSGVSQHGILLAWACEPWPGNSRLGGVLAGAREVVVENKAGSYRQTAQLFRLLSHPARLRILDALWQQDEACVCHLQSVLKQRQPYVSQQLRALRDAGLVDSRRDGLFIYYRLNDPWMVQLLDAVLGPVAKPQHSTPCTCPECRQV